MAVYFLQAQGHGGYVKIGTSENVGKRTQAFSTLPFKIKLLLTVPGDHRTERKFHSVLAKYRVRGEWFSPAPQVMAVVKWFSVWSSPSPPCKYMIKMASNSATVLTAQETDELRAAQNKRVMWAWGETNLGPTIGAFERHTGVAHGTSRAFLMGENLPMTRRTAEKIAKAFGVRPEWLLNGKGAARTRGMAGRLARINNGIHPVDRRAPTNSSEGD